MDMNISCIYCSVIMTMKLTSRSTQTIISDNLSSIENKGKTSFHIFSKRMTYIYEDYIDLHTGGQSTYRN